MAKKYKYRASFTFDGRRYEVYAETKAKLAERMSAKKKELESGLITGSISVQAFSKRWVEIYKEPVVSPATLQSVNGVVNHIVQAFGGKDLNQVDHGDCQKLLNQFNGRSYSLVSKVYIYTKGMFDSAIRERLLQFNPMLGCKLPSHTKGSKRALTESERELFLKACTTNEFGLWGLYLYYCGVRPSEPARLRFKHIDLAAAKIFVDGTKTKAAKRDVPIPRKLMQVLQPDNIDYCKPDEFVFRSVHGNPVTKTVTQRWWKSIIAEMESLAEAPWPGILHRVA